MKHMKIHLFALIATMATVAITIGVAAHLDISVKILTRDPYRAAQVPPYFAYASLLGSTIWLIGGTTALTSALVCRCVFNCRLKKPGLYQLVLPGGVIGLFMGIDDILLLHDAWADATHFPEIIFHIVYSGAIGLMILYGRKMIPSTPWLLLAGALAGYGLSSIVDNMPIFPETIHEAEDIFKLCGIVLWSCYFVVISRQLVQVEQKKISPRQQPASEDQ